MSCSKWLVTLLVAAGLVVPLFADPAADAKAPVGTWVMEKAHGLRARLVVENPLIETKTAGFFVSYLEIQNVSDKPITVVTDDPYAADVLISDSRGKNVFGAAYKYSDFVRLQAPATLQIKPGETQVVEVTVWDKAGGTGTFRPASVGALTFKAQFAVRRKEHWDWYADGWTGAIESPPAKVEVVAEDVGVAARIAELANTLRKEPRGDDTTKHDALRELALVGRAASPEMVKLLASPAYGARRWALLFFEDGQFVTPAAEALCREILAPSGDPKSARYDILVGAVVSGKLKPAELAELQRLAIQVLANADAQRRKVPASSATPR